MALPQPRSRTPSPAPAPAPHPPVRPGGTGGAAAPPGGPEVPCPVLPRRSGGPGGSERPRESPGEGGWPRKAAIPPNKEHPFSVPLLPFLRSVPEGTARDQ